MIPDQETIDALVVEIKKYNNAKTMEEGFSALKNLIEIGEKDLEKRLVKRLKPQIQCLKLATTELTISGKTFKFCTAHAEKLAKKATAAALVQGYQQCEVVE